MKTFIQFIQEASVTPIKSDQLDPQEAIEVIKKNCSDSLWMFKHETATILRGEKRQSSILGKNGIAIIDTSKSERKSATTSNWYTLIIDNSPEYKNYPKRSQSLICTNDIEAAKAYGSTMAIIPFNDAKIGVVNEPDIWDKMITMGGEKMDLVHANSYFDMLKEFGLSDTNWQSFIEFDKKLKTDKKFKDSVEKSVKGTPIESLLDDFVNKVRKVFDKLEFVLLTPKQYREDPPGVGTEIWIGGKIVCLRLNVFKSLCYQIEK